MPKLSVFAGLSAIPRAPGVYFIASHDLTMVKIGKSMKPRKRIRDIRAMNPHPIVVLACVPGYSRVEYYFHTRFAALRSHGEWFHFKGDLKATVELLASGERGLADMCPGPANADRVELEA